MPYRKQNGWGYTKPTLGTPLNKSHPLAPTVADYLLNERGGSRIHNQVDPTHNRLAKGASCNWVYYPSGFGFGGSGQASGQGANVVADDSRLQINPPLTLIWWGILIDGTGSNARVGGVEANNSNTTPFVSYTLARLNGTVVSFYGNVANTATKMCDSGTLSTLTPYMIAVCAKNGTQNMYVNGVLQASPGTTTWTSIPYTSPMIGIGSSITGAADPGVQSTRMMIYDRFLNQDEIRSLYTISFKMRPPPRRRIISAISAAAASTVLPYRSLLGVGI